MKDMEQVLSQRLSNDQEMEYPDFEAMWNSIQLDTARHVDLHEVSTGIIRKHRSWQSIAAISTVAVVLLSTPVYAAITNDWYHFLPGRDGIRSAMQQGLGQTLNQSVTHNGVTITLHTAFADDNRTVILYSINPGSHQSDILSFPSIGLRDAAGNVIKGSYSHRWDEQSRTFKGYFETEWTPAGNSAQVQFDVNNIQFLQYAKRDLTVDPLNNDTQVFPINQDGLGTLTIQAFTQPENKVLLRSSLTFDKPEAKEWAFPSLEVMQNEKLVAEEKGGTFGTPGEHEGYTFNQFFKFADLQQPSTIYQLSYIREKEQIDGHWDMSIDLNKQQMLSGTVKRELNLPLPEFPGDAKVKEMVITPTQVKIIISHTEKYIRMPYMKYTLDVNGSTLYGGTWSRESSKETEMRFELSPDLRITKDTPITLVGNYKVTDHTDKKQAIHFSNISEEHQTVTADYNGYLLKWTYYKKDGDLYVESECKDPSFGGINQTYIMEDGDRKLGKPLTVNFSGDGINKAVDVYRQFDSTAANVYAFGYTTDERQKEMRINLSEER